MEDVVRLKIDIEHIIKYLYSDSLTVADKERLNKYISTLNINQLNVFKALAEKYKDLTKYGGFKKYKITKNSIKLALKILRDTDIAVFPCIEKIACKGWSISDGTFAFGMYMLDYGYPAKKIYSDVRTKNLLGENMKLEYDIFNDFEIITIATNDSVAN